MWEAPFNPSLMPPFCVVAVLVLPGIGAELAQQVGRVVRALSASGLRVRSAVMTGGQTEADRRNKTFRTQVGLLVGA